MGKRLFKVEATKEAKGREKTLALINLKDKFCLGQKLKFKNFKRIIEGRVIQKTEHLLVVKAKNEIISLAYIDFYTKKAIII